MDLIPLEVPVLIPETQVVDFLSKGCKRDTAGKDLSVSTGDARMSF